MGSALQDCCGSPDQSRPTPSNVERKKKSYSGKKINITSGVIIVHIISLNELQLKQAWQAIDVNNKNNDISTWQNYDSNNTGTPTPAMIHNDSTAANRNSSIIDN
eukprot:342296_1